MYSLDCCHWRWDSSDVIDIMARREACQYRQEKMNSPACCYWRSNKGHDDVIDASSKQTAARWSINEVDHVASIEDDTVWTRATSAKWIKPRHVSREKDGWTHLLVSIKYKSTNHNLIDRNAQEIELLVEWWHIQCALWLFHFLLAYRCWTYTNFSKAIHMDIEMWQVGWIGIAEGRNNSPE